ncbi:MAG: tagaturonate reductase [Peptococcaceae bacterium]|nr:tagaturonate reductase [Peptococcaceae bacterium]
MERLNKAMLGHALQAQPQNYQALPERVIQFGEGNFLRAFVDWMFDSMNKQGIFNGRVVVIQPLAGGLVNKLNEQDGLYNLILRGMRDGEAVAAEQLVTSISRGINPYTEWAEYLRCAEDPAIEFVVSNTTEAGIAYNPEDRPDAKPPASFPGKLAVYLYHRYQHFAGDPSKGMVIIPCELIDRNGDNLRSIVLRLADEWGWPAAFRTWLEQHNYFLNSLVDRVVPGYPKDEVAAIAQRLGYEDQLLDTGELFHLWVIEGPQAIKARLPFTQAGLNVIWTDDMSPYRTRKVRILNGAHTACVPVAFLFGLDTVGEMVDHNLLGQYTREVMFEEIIPSINLDVAMLTDFANAVMERFQNPYIKHYLLSILLNSTSKFKTRVVPSLLGYIERNACIPEKLSFSFAALLALYKGEIHEDRLTGKREQGEFTLQDDQAALQKLQKAWSVYDGTSASIQNLTQSLLSDASLWGENLNSRSGLSEKVAGHLAAILQKGMHKALVEVLAK